MIKNKPIFLLFVPLSKNYFPLSFPFGESTRRGIEVWRGVRGEAWG